MLQSVARVVTFFVEMSTSFTSRPVYTIRVIYMISVGVPIKSIDTR